MTKASLNREHENKEQRMKLQGFFANVLDLEFRYRNAHKTQSNNTIIDSNEKSL